MSTSVAIQSEPLLDPRGEFRRTPTALAPRFGNLKGKTVLLFDNTQLTSMQVSHGPMFQWLSALLEKDHGAHCTYQSQNLLKLPKEALTALADEIARGGTHAVILALCNAGITQATSLFAAELELRGLACVQICTENSYPLAGITASNYVPGLPIVLASPATGTVDVFGKTETGAIAPEIVSGLTDDPSALLARFRERFSATSSSIAADGKIQLAPVDASVTQMSGTATVMLDPGHFAGQLYDELCAADIGDGLPVIPPTQARVNAMLAFTDCHPDVALISEMPPSGATLTVRSLAVNAVMAGCQPEYFPVLMAAFQAIADPVYRAFQGAITTHPSGNAVVVSGPLADELGIQSGPGCLGPGFRANATIGRAVNLTLMNVARAIPGQSDMGTHGSPAEFSYCFADSRQNNPWQPLNADLFSAETTSVTVHKCESPHNVLDPRGSPEELLKSIAAVAATPGGNNLLHPSQLLVILNPSQARKVATAGWSKRAVKEFLFETARNPVELARKQERATFPPEFLKLPRVPVMRSPDDVILVVCGGAGGHAMVGVPWGLAQAVSRPVTRKDGTPLRSVKDMLRGASA